MKQPSDVRFLIAPFRFLWGMVVCLIFLLVSPLMFLGALIIGIHGMSPDDIGLMKILLVVLGPFAFTFWWIIFTHFSGRYRAKRLIASRSETGEDFSDAELVFLGDLNKPRTLRTLGMLLVSFAGSVSGAWLLGNAGDQLFFLGVLVGIFSPAIIIAAFRLLVG